MNEPVSAPLFRVEICAFAWTDKQAASIKAQIETMFTGTEVRIVPNVRLENTDTASAPAAGNAESGAAASPAAPSAPTISMKRADAFVDNLLKSGVSESKVFAALGATIAPPTPAPGAAAAGAPKPDALVGSSQLERYAVGERLQDRFTGVAVTVSAVNDRGFEYTTDDNKPGKCPWTSAGCYERISTTGARSASADTSSKAPVAKSPEPKTSKRVRVRPHKPAAPKDTATLSPTKLRTPGARRSAKS